ncbi:MAG: hypothetical protein GY926_04790 [bacterium]|nr:hypothetical protein [bacterium]
MAVSRDQNAASSAEQLSSNPAAIEAYVQVCENLRYYAAQYTDINRLLMLVLVGGFGTTAISDADAGARSIVGAFGFLATPALWIFNERTSTTWWAYSQSACEIEDALDLPVKPHSKRIEERERQSRITSVIGSRAIYAATLTAFAGLLVFGAL